MSHSRDLGALLVAGVLLAFTPPSANASPSILHPEAGPATAVRPVQYWDGYRWRWDGERERWGREGGRGEQCERLRYRAREIRERLGYNLPPWERERLEHRLYETRGEFRSACGEWRDRW